jgi:hypothetical protein
MQKRRKITIILAVLVVVPVIVMYSLTRSACQAERMDLGLAVKPLRINDSEYDNQMNIALQELASHDKVFSGHDLAKASKVRGRLVGDLPSSSLTPMNDGDIYYRATHATLALYSNSVENVKIRGGAQLGSAFVISHTGIAATCFHALQYDIPFVVNARTFDGKKIGIRSILATFPQQDLAFIQLEGSEFEALPLRLDAPAGTPIRQLGHPLSVHFFMSNCLPRYTDFARRAKSAEVIFFV